jgi:hypothetical protein
MFANWKLIENWRSAWRWFSVQALFVLAALPIVWTSLPEDLKDDIPQGWLKWVMMALAVGGLAGRFVDQKGKDQ